jgi:hypothetical protein
MRKQKRAKQKETDNELKPPAKKARTNTREHREKHVHMGALVEFEYDRNGSQQVAKVTGLHIEEKCMTVKFNCNSGRQVTHTLGYPTPTTDHPKLWKAVTTVRTSDSERAKQKEQDEEVQEWDPFCPQSYMSDEIDEEEEQKQNEKAHEGGRQKETKWEKAKNQEEEKESHSWHEGTCRQQHAEQRDKTREATSEDEQVTELRSETSYNAMLASLHLQKGAKPNEVKEAINSKTKEGVYPIHVAIEDGRDVNWIRRLLVMGGYDQLKPKNLRDDTPLQHAKYLQGQLYSKKAKSLGYELITFELESWRAWGSQATARFKHLEKMRSSNLTR